MVVMFYAALHYTKAAILRDQKKVTGRHEGWTDEAAGRHYPGHNDLVNWHLPPEIATYYGELFDISIQARYEDFFRDPGMTLHEAERQRELLRKIKTHCFPHA